MRKIIALSMITLDGVMQAPGGPKEDTSGGFKYGGWTAPYGDEVFGKVMEKELKPADYLLGRKTFEIFASYWPEHPDFWPGINDGTKYVLSRTRKKSEWKNSVFIKSLADIKKLKKSKGSDIQVWGSSKLIQLATSELEKLRQEPLELKASNLLIAAILQMCSKAERPAFLVGRQKSH